MKILNYLLLCFLFTLLACGPSRNVSFNTTRPAQITMPSDANTILLVDRTKFGNEMVNILEGILTGEMPADDKVAAQEAMINLKNKLDNSPRFSVKILPERLIGNSLTAAFPDALPWNVIDNLCATNNAEIVVALEVFDSNFLITNGTRVKKKYLTEGANKKEVEYTEYYAQGVGSVKIGIRTYYAKNRDIVDQQMVDKKNTWEAVGNSPRDAIAALISKSNANKYLAARVGEAYAYKISPMPVRITRPFYGKSKHVSELETGTRYADVNQWTQAIDTWKSAIPKAQNKDAGQLAYNIAIGYEVLGEYGNALTWAQDAYTKYGNKLSRTYVYQLQRRIDEENVLKTQMNH